MTAALVLGAAFGLSLLVAIRTAWPRREPMQTALHRRPRQPTVWRAAHDDGGGLTASAGRLLLGLLPGDPPVGREPLLRLAGRNATEHLGAKAVLGLVGLLLAPAWVALIALGGVSVPAPVWLAGMLALGTGGWVLPELLLRTEAASRRRDFLTALGSFLDLVVISLAGGAGVESAMTDAVQVGRGAAFTRLRDALEGTRLTGETPWAALGRLGDELDLPPLCELAASASLAGTEGARVRASLTAKAAALRARQLADAEAEASSTTEAMAVPTVLLLVGFLILIGYPAIDTVLTGL